MTETAKTVFERFEVRKSRKQKTAFIEWVTKHAAENGYAVKVEKGSFRSRNIVVGDPDKAKVIYTAHYDTCPVMPVPNFITPKSLLIYILYQLAVVALMLIPPFAVGIVCSYYDWALVGVLPNLILWLEVILLLFGPANKHTANDNTSGVITLLELMDKMPEEQRAKAAFIFFDLEEVGLIGSMSFAEKHKKAMKNKLIVNFDCVSDGKHFLFVVRKKAKGFCDALKEAFCGDERFTVEIATKGAIYPSDQASFPCGVGVAALKRSKLFGILYMNRIHTKRDTVFEEENIDFLTDGAVKLAAVL